MMMLDNMVEGKQVLSEKETMLIQLRMRVIHDLKVRLKYLVILRL
jgi:hypothetical protein